MFFIKKNPTTCYQVATYTKEADANPGWQQKAVSDDEANEPDKR